MVLLKMLMKIGLPKMRGLLVMTMASISPGGIAPTEGKSYLPKFRLETAALRPESPLLIFFSRANGLIYQKLGTGGWPGAPQATKAHRGAVGAPWCLMAPGWSPQVFLFSSIFYLFQNDSP